MTTLTASLALGLMAFLALLATGAVVAALFAFPGLAMAVLAHLHYRHQGRPGGKARAKRGP
jgi:hypothetical protein